MKTFLRRLAAASVLSVAGAASGRGSPFHSITPSLGVTTPRFLTLPIRIDTFITVKVEMKVSTRSRLALWRVGRGGRIYSGLRETRRVDHDFGNCKLAECAPSGVN